MDLNSQKEQFSLAYVRAVAAAARCGTKILLPDDQSIDIELSRVSLDRINGLDAQLAIQVKCTARDVLSDEYLSFPVTVDNYRDLRKPSLVPRLLVVHLVPPLVGDWLLHSEDEMLVRRCSYWLSLANLPEKANTGTVTVKIPRKQTFNPDTLTEIMDRIEKGEPV